MKFTRRHFLAKAAVGVAVASSGCINFEGYNGGRLRMLRLDAIPPGAEPVKRSNDILQSSDIIQTELENVAESSYIEHRLSRADFRELSSKLEKIPYYDRTEHPDNSVPSGYYVSLENKYSCIKLNAFCSDIPGVRMEKAENGSCVTK